MVDFTKWSDVQTMLTQAQEAEHDNREMIRRITLFLKKEDGQWDPSIISKMNGRYRGTFDRISPIIKSISGELKQADFDIKVKPAGGEATKDIAKILDGLVRNIENISNASQVFGASGKKMIETGFDAWRVTQEWADGDSFDQDLFIRKISNSVDRVWFDLNSEMQDRSDAKWCFVLSALSKDAYDEKFPDGGGLSVGEDRSSNAYCDKPEQVIVGEFLYQKEVDVELVQMSNAKVYRVDDDFEKVADDLAALGVTESGRRKRKTNVVWSRKFDGAGWLSEAKETVFQWIPVVPTYGNFEIIENKVVYSGAAQPLLDAQMAYNFTRSREIEEVALSPRGKYWGTRDQRAGHSDTIETLNTNANAWQDYNHTEGVPAPYWAGGAQVNPGLLQATQNSANDITESGGIFAANQGQALANQSGVAIERLQNKGDISTIDYFDSQEVAICHTARIIIDAIPRAIDTPRQMRILNEDGSFDMEMLNDTVIDEQTGEQVKLNDLTVGKYDVTCSAGPSFQNRQQETVKALTDLLGIDPSLLGLGADVLLNNISAPGLDLMADRARQRMIQDGVIPEDQLTDEEKERIQAQQEAAAQQQDQPDPIQQAIVEQTQAQTADVMSKAQERSDKTDIAVEKLRLEEQQQLITAQQNESKNELEAAKQIAANQKAVIDSLNTQAQTLKTLTEVLGAQGLVGPHTVEAAVQQAEMVTEAQDSISPTLETDQITRQ